MVKNIRLQHSLSMDAVGEFSLWSLMDFLDTDDDDTILSTIDLTTLEPLASTPANYVDMEKAIQSTNDFDLEAMPTDHQAASPMPSTSAGGIMPTSIHQPRPKKRFQLVSEQDLSTFESSHQSKATKQNTRWGIKLFQGTYLTNIELKQYIYRPHRSRLQVFLYLRIKEKLILITAVQT